MKKTLEEKITLDEEISSLNKGISSLYKIKTTVLKNTRTCLAAAALSIVGYGCGPDTCVKDSECKEGSSCREVCYSNFDENGHESTNKSCYHACQRPETTTTWVSDED